MGYMRHHAIIVTTYSRKLAQDAYLKAISIHEKYEKTLYSGPAPKSGLLTTLVSALHESPVNGYFSFCIYPDGSKEGPQWVESKAGDELRDEFIAWLESQRHEDGSSSYDYAYVRFGDADGEDMLLWSSKSNGTYDGKT